MTCLQTSKQPGVRLLHPTFPEYLMATLRRIDVSNAIRFEQIEVAQRNATEELSALKKDMESRIQTEVKKQVEEELGKIAKANSMVVDDDDVPLLESPDSPRYSTPLTELEEASPIILTF